MDWATIDFLIYDQNYEPFCGVEIEINGPADFTNEQGIWVYCPNLVQVFSIAVTWTN